MCIGAVELDELSHARTEKILNSSRPKSKQNLSFQKRSSGLERHSDVPNSRELEKVNSVRSMLISLHSGEEPGRAVGKD